jgi:hypothetical protein
MSLRLLAPLLWILVVAAALEVALEVRAQRLGWPTLLFGAPQSAEADGAANGPTREFPFRSPLLAASAASSAPRVWFASASYGEDVQLAVREVFPNLTVELLRERGIECVALNASSAGHTTASNAAELRERGGEFNPRVVVLYQMSNDIDKLSATLGARGWRSAAERSAPPSESLVKAAAPNEGFQWGLWLGRQVEATTIYKHLKSLATSRVATQRPLVDTLGSEGELLFEQRVLELVAAARASGATPVLCTFATAYTLDNLASTPQEYELNLLRFNVFLSLRGWLDSVERFNAVLRAVAEREQVQLIDVSAALSGRSELFRDMVHFPKVGHAEVARLMADDLARTPALTNGAPR